MGAKEIVALRPTPAVKLWFHLIHSPPSSSPQEGVHWNFRTANPSMNRKNWIRALSGVNRPNLLVGNNWLDAESAVKLFKDCRRDRMLPRPRSWPSSEWPASNDWFMAWPSQSNSGPIWRAILARELSMGSAWAVTGPVSHVSNPLYLILLPPTPFHMDWFLKNMLPTKLCLCPRNQPTVVI